MTDLPTNITGSFFPDQDVSKLDPTLFSKHGSMSADWCTIRQAAQLQDATPDSVDKDIVSGRVQGDLHSQELAEQALLRQQQGSKERKG